MTHGTIAGILLTDILQGRENPWADLYDPGRTNLRAARDYVSELAKSNVPFGQMGDAGRGRLARARSRPAKAASSAAASTRSRSTATRWASWSSSPPPARTSAASWSGTRARSRGTVPATARASRPTATSSTARPRRPFRGPSSPDYRRQIGQFCMRGSRPNTSSPDVTVCPVSVSRTVNTRVRPSVRPENRAGCGGPRRTGNASTS